MSTISCSSHTRDDQRNAGKLFKCKAMKIFVVGVVAKKIMTNQVHARRKNNNPFNEVIGNLQLKFTSSTQCVMSSDI